MAALSHTATPIQTSNLLGLLGTFTPPPPQKLNILIVASYRFQTKLTKILACLEVAVPRIWSCGFATGITRRGTWKRKTTLSLLPSPHCWRPYNYTGCEQTHGASEATEVPVSPNILTSSIWCGGKRSRTSQERTPVVRSLPVILGLVCYATEPNKKS